MGSSSPPPQPQSDIVNFMKPKEEEDRISELSDDILGRILYFLPSNVAATTTVLSSRWKHVFWSTATRLNINFNKERCTKDNVETAIRLFETVFNSKTITSAYIATPYFHLPATICAPNLKHLHIHVNGNLKSLCQAYNSFHDMKRHNTEGGTFSERFILVLSDNDHLVLLNPEIPKEEHLLEIKILRSFREFGSDSDATNLVSVLHNHYICRLSSKN